MISTSEFDRQVIVGNGFVREFLRPRQPRLSSLDEIEHEIEDEKQNWQRSGVPEQIADLWLQSFQDHKLYRVPPSARERDILIGVERACIFGDYKAEGAAGFVESRILRQLPRTTLEHFKDLATLEEDYRRDFREAVKPLTNHRRVLANQLISELGDFVSADLGCLAGFAEFLTAEEFAASRIQTHSFLQAIERDRRMEYEKNNRTDFLELARRKLVEQALSVPPPDFFSNFVENLLETSPKNGNERSALDWILLFLDGEIDPSYIYNRILQKGIFPKELRLPFNKSFDEATAAYTIRARQALETFRPEVTQQLILGLKTISNKRKGRSTGIAIKGISAALEEVREKPNYKLDFHGQGLASEDNLWDLIERYSKGIPMTDERMRQDLVNSVQALKQNPYGLGARKLTDFMITDLIRGQLPLRRFRADRSLGLMLQHEEAKRVRIVYYMNPAIPNTITILEILHHDVFDRKYAS